MSSQGNCPNCGGCLCTGATLTRCLDGRVCCSSCVKKVNIEINEYLKLNPGISLNILKRTQRTNLK